MCLAVIGKVVQVGDNKTLADVEGNLATINIELTPDVCEGEYVLIHAGFAIATMEEDEAVEIQVLINEMSELLDHAK